MRNARRGRGNLSVNAILRQLSWKALYHCGIELRACPHFARPKAELLLNFVGVLPPLLIAIFAWTQSQSLHDTSVQFLLDHHISITKQAVTAALRTDDAEIRREASRVLSSHWPKEAAAPIRIAMSQEGDELVRVSLATDLARLGDKAGREMLLTECHNTGDWGSTRMYAAEGVTELPRRFLRGFSSRNLALAQRPPRYECEG